MCICTKCRVMLLHVDMLTLILDSDVRSLVGELDFSFHAISTAHFSARSSISDTTRPNTPIPSSVALRDKAD